MKQFNESFITDSRELLLHEMNSSIIDRSINAVIGVSIDREDLFLDEETAKFRDKIKMRGE